MTNHNDKYLTVSQEPVDKEENMLSDDIIETTIGRFGRYQLWIIFLIAIGRVPAEFQLTNVVFLLPKVDYVCMDENAYNLTDYCPCENPQYDHSLVGNSVTSTWNLICDKNQLASLAQSILQVGILFGSLIYGYVSDRYGRKIASLLALISKVTFVALSTVSTELWMFVVLRFLIGTAVGGTILCSYTIIIELGGKSFRPYLTGLIEVPYILAYVTLPIIVYYTRDWKQLQLLTSLPWVFVAFYFFLIPESPIWLITTGQSKKAVEVLTHIAKKNNRPIESIKDLVEKAVTKTQQSSRCKHYGSYVDLFKTPNIRIYTIITAFIWMCCSFTFYGINQYIGRLQGNIYLNVLISSISLFPGLICILVSFYLKRKVSVIACFLVAGVSLLMFIIMPSDIRVAELIFAIIGQIGARTGLVLMYLYASEVFPTVVRNSALGFASVFARFGGFIAPFVVNIGIEWVSIVIFASLAFCAAFFCSFLPETKDIILLNTIDQIEKSKNVERQNK